MVLIALVLTVMGLLQIICLLALVDQYKGLLQIRDRLELKDTALDLPVSDLQVRAAGTGLPPSFTSDDVAVGLLFSTKCLSCASVAEGLKGRVPGGAWAIIAGSEPQCEEFRAKAGLTGDRVLLDIGGRITDKLRVRTFPSALLFSNGRLAAAKSVPSYRELRHVLADWDTPAAADGGHGNHDHTS